RVQAGDLLLINPSIPHGYVPDTSEGFTVQNVMFTAQALEHILPFPEVARVMGVFLRSGPLGRPAQVSLGRSTRDATAIGNLVNALLAEHTRRASGYRAVMAGL